MSVNHYENFPVASILLPRRLRPAVHAIYAFARSADDLADEGDASPKERLAALNQYEQALGCIQKQQKIPSSSPSSLFSPSLFDDLAKIVRDYKLPLQPFYDLLSAFKQDVVTTRYTTYDALLDYCTRSAQPVGRLMLALYGADNPQNCRDSDAICSALQLINFWQDIAIDQQKQRIYLPQEDLEHFGVTESQIEQGIINPEWCNLMHFQIAHAQRLMLSGAPLALRLPGRIGWELRLVIQGGLRILEKIEAVDYDVFKRRPQLNVSDWIRILWRAVWMSKSMAATINNHS